jgi:lipoprotein-anchoring transpeptidase ErfK/SrfK
MFANADSLFRGSWPAIRPSGRPLLIAIVAAGIALSGSRADAAGPRGQPLPGTPLSGTPDAVETAAIQVEASRLQAQYRADATALLASAQTALTTARNEATIAVFLRLGRAGRLDAGLERYGAMLAAADPQHAALAAAGIQHYGTQLHKNLLQEGPSQLITLSLHGQRLIAYDRGRVVVDTLVTSGRPALATDIGAMRIIRKDSPWTMQSPWPKGSPEWYPDTPVRMVLWFTHTGEGFHDASWQPDSTLGPGSQNGRYASHGCVHLPLAAETTLFQWATIGMAVVVYPGDGTSAASQVAQQTIDAAGNPTTGVRGD